MKRRNKRRSKRRKKYVDDEYEMREQHSLHSRQSSDSNLSNEEVRKDGIFSTIDNIGDGGLGDPNDSTRGGYSDLPNISREVI